MDIATPTISQITPEAAGVISGFLGALGGPVVLSYGIYGLIGAGLRLGVDWEAGKELTRRHVVMTLVVGGILPMIGTAALVEFFKLPLWAVPPVGLGGGWFGLAYLKMLAAGDIATPWPFSILMKPPIKSEKKDA